MQASNLRGAEAPTTTVTWPLRPEDDGEGVAGLEELSLPASVSARIKPSRLPTATVGCTWEDSNLRPDAYRAPALAAEPQVPGELPGNRTQLDAG